MSSFVDSEICFPLRVENFEAKKCVEKFYDSKKGL
jgi:hypothetical protein